MKGTKKDIGFIFCYLNCKPLEQKNPLFQELIGLFGWHYDININKRRYHYYDLY